MLKGTVVLISVLTFAVAWQALAPLEPKPDKFNNVEGCYISDLDQMIPFGESGQAPSGEKSCQKYSCGRELVKITGCGSVSTAPPCEVVATKSKPYPDCCPTIQCPKSSA